ncbi:NAD(P)/FAD-dependent oxidoreductase [Ascidiimonas sp. W6]|uniref:NAD(P)/FAD-dependent oxidoreductase n=1 Tax=Ascidiimonas meishanensis TaxID=3128903 RepID=UPI0030EC5F98
MNSKKQSVCIIGAGISGLIAALVLEKNGFSPKIFEVTDRPGGRVKTTYKDGFPLDHGFQVLLEAYPKAKQYLDYEALELKKFVPGAAIFLNGNKKIIGDPIRDISLAWPTLLSGIGNLSDKWKVLNLNFTLKNKSLEAIFQDSEQTTLSYLQKKGFSERMIHDFFKPFFTGIFLETTLETSSRMFEFVYKMFGEGLAVIPQNGIGAIPNQLVNKLEKTEIHYNSKVERIEEDQIFLENSKRIGYDAVIIASGDSGLITEDSEHKIHWKSCDNLYFKTGKPILKKSIIGLIADADALINNIHYPSVVQNIKKKEEGIISVTVVKEHQLSSEDLQKQVIEELKKYCGIEVTSCISHFPIQKALPDLKNLTYDIKPEATSISKGVFRAGDQLLNGSLNAAMISGERAAEAVIKYLK